MLHGSEETPTILLILIFFAYALLTSEMYHRLVVMILFDLDDI